MSVSEIEAVEHNGGIQPEHESDPNPNNIHDNPIQSNYSTGSDPNLEESANDELKNKSELPIKEEEKEGKRTFTMGELLNELKNGNPTPTPLQDSEPSDSPYRSVYLFISFSFLH